MDLLSGRIRRDAPHGWRARVVDGSDTRLLAELEHHAAEIRALSLGPVEHIGPSVWSALQKLRPVELDVCCGSTDPVASADVLGRMECLRVVALRGRWVELQHVVELSTLASLASVSLDLRGAAPESLEVAMALPVESLSIRGGVLGPRAPRLARGPRTLRSLVLTDCDVRSATKSLIALAREGVRVAYTGGVSLRVPRGLEGSLMVQESPSGLEVDALQVDDASTVTAARRLVVSRPAVLDVRGAGHLVRWYRCEELVIETPMVSTLAIEVIAATWPDLVRLAVLSRQVDEATAHALPRGLRSLLCRPAVSVEAILRRCSELRSLEIMHASLGAADVLALSRNSLDRLVIRQCTLARGCLAGIERWAPVQTVMEWNDVEPEDRARLARLRSRVPLFRVRA